MPDMTAIASLLPPEVTPFVALLLVAVSFGCSLITIAFGIGGGALMLAILASFLPPAALIPVHGLVQLGSNAGRMLALLRHVSWVHMGGFALGACVGVVMGGLMVVNVPAAAVQIGVGCFVLWSVFVTPPRWLRTWPILAGWTASVLTMFFGATGPYVATYTKSLPLSRHGYVATHGALMTLQHLLKTVAFGFLGFAFGPWLGLILALILAGLAGTLTGRLVLNGLTDARFRVALNVVLVLVALNLIVQGVRRAF